MGGAQRLRMVKGASRWRAVSVPRPDPLPRDVTSTLGRPKPTGATRSDPDRQRGRAGPMTAPSGSVAGRSASRGCLAGSNRASSV